MIVHCATTLGRMGHSVDDEYILRVEIPRFGSLEPLINVMADRDSVSSDDRQSHPPNRMLFFYPLSLELNRKTQFEIQ